MASWQRWGPAAAVAMTVGLFGGAGCGDTDHTVSSSTGDSLTASDIDGRKPSMSEPPPTGWGIAVPKVRSMRASSDDRKLVVKVTVSPVRLADRTCGASPAFGEVSDEGNPEVIWASTRVEVPDVSADETPPKWAEEYGPCPMRNTDLVLEIGAPLVGRDVVLDQIRWVPNSAGNYGVCELPACDPENGKVPAIADCEGSSLVEDVRLYGDVGRHATIGESRCQDGWAMVETDIGAGACPAGDGANPCAGERIDRLFLRATAPHWEVLTRTRDAGCGDVLKVAPNFPTALCRDRPAL